jgi:hypothetical protein
LLVLASLLGCNTTDNPPTGAVQLLPADPGQLLPTEPPQSYGFATVIGWDLDHNAVLLLDKPHQVPANIMRVDLDTREASLVATATKGVAELRASGGVTLYTSFETGTSSFSLNSVAAGKLTAAGRPQFTLSQDGKWVVFYDAGWKRMDLTTGTRVSLPESNALPIAISDDGSRVAFATLGYGPATVVTVASGSVQSVSTIDRVLDGVFEGPDLHLLTMAESFAGERRTYQFYDQSASDRVAIGTVYPVPNGYGSGSCGAWSHGPGPRTAIVTAQMTFNYAAPTRNRFNILRLGATPELVGSDDLWATTDCSVSPDGRWFVYGEPSGPVAQARLFLKKIE